MNNDQILAQTRALRAQGRIQESFELARTTWKGREHDVLLWQHQPMFWSEIAAGNCMLTRRNGADVKFVRELWDNKKFIRSFHPLAAPLPQSDARLTEILQNEYSSLVLDSKALHWVVRDRNRKPWGLLSLTDIALRHRRAEVLLGVLPNAPYGLAPAAMLVLFQFYFNALKFNKLYSLIFDDNSHSLKGTLHLGFKQEGHLRQEVIDPATGKPADLIRTGLLREEAFSAANKKLMERLLR
jgi:RimJ/RimL family protein N-acetyltransferase